MIIYKLYAFIQIYQYYIVRTGTVNIFYKIKGFDTFCQILQILVQKSNPCALDPHPPTPTVQFNVLKKKGKGGGVWGSSSKSMFNTSCVTLPFLVHLLLHCDNDQCGLCCHNLPLPRAQRRPCLGHQQCSLVPRTGTFPRHILQVKGRVLQSINSPLCTDVKRVPILRTGSLQGPF